MKDISIPITDPSSYNAERVEILSRYIRACAIKLSHTAKTPHLGSALSCADILAVVYGGSLSITPDNATSPDRDRIILSKGHAAIALYSALVFQGFFPKELLNSYAEPGSSLAEQPIPHSQPGIEAATGSLGHGLPIGVGMATAGRIHKKDYRVVVLMSDGECNEGSVWEAALFAGAQKLSNLTVVVDFNKWQATGRSEEVMALNPFSEKWRAFGWNSIEIDGHNHNEIRKQIELAASSDKPTAIVAHTVKGKGVSYMEDDNNWHYRIPTEAELQAAYKELKVS